MPTYLICAKFMDGSWVPMEADDLGHLEHKLISESGWSSQDFEECRIAVEIEGHKQSCSDTATEGEK